MLGEQIGADRQHEHVAFAPGLKIDLLMAIEQQDVAGCQIFTAPDRPRRTAALSAEHDRARRHLAMDQERGRPCGAVKLERRSVSQREVSSKRPAAQLDDTVVPVSNRGRKLVDVAKFRLRSQPRREQPRVCPRGFLGSLQFLDSGVRSGAQNGQLPDGVRVRRLSRLIMGPVLVITTIPASSFVAKVKS